MGGNGTRMIDDALTIEEVAFDRDLHAYYEGGRRCMSVTQALNISGLVDFRRVPREILEAAQYRGKLVHHAAAIIDRGEDLGEYDVPEVFGGYVEAYANFMQEMKFKPNREWIERSMIVVIFGQIVGMTPDAVGLIDGVPTLVERKTSAAYHPAWTIQTAGYELGLRAAGLQIRQRFSLRLHPDGRYKLDAHDDRGDFDTFGDCFRLASWRLKNRLSTLD